ncbi:Hypothetical protein CB129slpB_1108 [Propionibacterium freudenreichii]|uniref:hypothetical protein n=1 Tax=Propionibacterium freudenreichii TaxID=1744 RepID=UPI0004A12B78|nr:hypothetical protein [Propionibacterium freudenreichii]AWY95808.1 Hypothetical protein CB129slpB_1108 [Propionibacterium freudenreichii]CDP48242.1 Hypothetical protein PFCIRM129_10930 [Propionibacterium freudenreichii subsp. freudenreichii]
MSPNSTPEAALDLTRAPRGELAAARLIATAAASGDLAERHYLELKGPPDLSSKVNKAKIAKFILGAANRMPERAAEAFEGYGVMIIGIAKNAIEGVPPIEMLSLSQVIQPFLGATGPHWDIVRVPIENSPNQVIVVLVDPPQTGQPPFICRANGEGLQNGRIYYRGDGETREPTADELDLLMARGSAQPTAPVELGVSVVGTVVPLAVDEERTLNEYIAKTRKRLLDALPAPKPSTPASRQPGQLGAAGVTSGLSSLHSLGTGLSEAMSRIISEQASGALGTAGILAAEVPEQRSEEDYKDEIEAWASQFREAWPDALEAFAVRLMPANEVGVVNKTLTFLHDVEIKLHIAGAVEALEREWYEDSLSLNDVGLPYPPRKWGPTKRNFGLDTGYSASLAASIAAQSVQASRSYVPPDASWRTTGSVDVDVNVGNLRPEGAFQTEDDDSILIVRGEAPENIRATWAATAQGYNEVFKGDFTVPVAEPTCLTELIRECLGLR